MRRLLSALAIAAACTAPVRAPDPPHADAARESTVIVDSRCSGVVVTSRSVLTAAHCVHRRTVLLDTWADPEPCPAELLTLHEWADLAELRTDRIWHRVPVTRLPIRGELATVIHHRCPGGWCAAPAVVVYVSHRHREAALDWTARDGSSGSGVWGTDSALLGIVISAGSETGRTYFALVP